MNYRSQYELTQSVYDLSIKIPQNIDLVVGVPRSGLFPASVFALHRNLPITDVDGLVEERIMGAGERLADLGFNEQGINEILILDDSVNTGNEMDRVKEKIRNADLDCNIWYSTIFTTESGKEYVDYYAEVVPIPRVFEWNIMHHEFLNNACVEFEGVLAEPLSTTDISSYLHKLENSNPIVVPDVELGIISTRISDEYRPEIESWLERHGIEFDKLIMSQLDEEICGGEVYIQQKVNVYQNPNVELFVESDKEVANQLVESTGKPVFYYENRTMINSNAITQDIHRGSMFINRFAEDPKNAFRILLKSLRYQLKRL